MVSATVLDTSVQPSQKSSHRNLSGYRSNTSLRSAHPQLSHPLAQSIQAHPPASSSKLGNLMEKKSSVLATHTLPARTLLASTQTASTQRLGQSRDTLAKLHLVRPTRRARKARLVNPSLVPAPIKLPSQPRLPSRLRLLHRIQQRSAVLTSLLVTSALVVYGSSVFMDKSTDRAVAQLNALQSESQQLATANESIKQSLAEQAAREDSGLELYESDDMLFITPEPQRAKTDVDKEKPAWLQPLGY